VTQGSSGVLRSRMLLTDVRLPCRARIHTAAHRVNALSCHCASAASRLGGQCVVHQLRGQGGRAGMPTCHNTKPICLSTEPKPAAQPPNELI
jgi:hypothetical protein